MVGFSTNDNPSHQGKTNTWFTPYEIVRSLGSFDLDPCSQSFRPKKLARREFFHDKGDDGLLLEWSGRVWLNPPYGKEIGKWLDRLHSHGNGIALVFSRTETRWAQKELERCDAVNFIRGRISFIHESGKESHNASNGSMLLAYGRQNIESIFNIDGVAMDSHFLRGKYEA